MKILPVNPEVGDKRLEFKYDYLGRRVEEFCWIHDGSDWPVEYDYCRRFVYDGWNVIEVLDGFNAVEMKLTWGLDLSGSLHGAGGVGGLLAPVWMLQIFRKNR
jgi:hypothetical protein